MHYTALVTVDIPDCSVCDDKDMSVRAQIAKLEQLKTDLNAKNDSTQKVVSIEWEIRYLKSILTPFSRAVDKVVEEKLEPFGEEPTDPRYLQFADETENLKSQYETDRFDFIKFSNGSIVPTYEIQTDFCIKDGKVYQKNVGQVKFDKRTKRAKRMTALLDYPLKKAYKTFEKCAANFFRMDYDEQHHGYGYMVNFNAFWDGYSIGGHWPCAFLVKDDCLEYSEGEHVDKIPNPPKGYKWASAVRKKDIQWVALIAYQKECQKRYFETMREAFAKKQLPNDLYGLGLREDGFYAHGEAVYLNGETFEANLRRRLFLHDADYIATVSYLVSNGKWQTEDMILRDDGVDSWIAWRKTLTEFYHGLSDETVLVLVDIHN